MTISSRFAGRCKACGGDIKAGETINWTRDGGASHLTPARCADAVAAKAARPVVTANGAPIAAFIAAAKARGLKFPKARFLAPDGRAELRLSLAGDGSKYPGSVQVKIGDAWIGRIQPDGTVAGPMRDRADVLATLAAIAADPAKAASAYGALMCRCSFCDKALTDAGSVEVGYGPVCAEKWGLPHKPKGTPAVGIVGVVAA